MEPIFTEDQLKNMSREALIELMQVMQEKQRKTETKMKLMEEKQKELEFLNAMLSDRLTLAKKQRFGASSEKYADGYEQMNLFNEAEAASDGEPDPEKEIEVTSHKRKKHAGKKEEDLSHFEVTERILTCGQLILSAEWSKKLFTIIHYELQNSRCIVTHSL